MDQETVRFELSDLVGYLPKCTYSSCEAEAFPSIYDDLQNSKKVVRMEAEKGLVELIQRDDRDQLVSRLKRLSEEAPNKEDFDELENRDPQLNQPIDRTVASRLLQHSCELDSVECATALIEGEAGPVPSVNEMGGSRRTALHSAAEMHATRCIELLLRKQARTDVRSIDGNSQIALELALSSKMMQVPWSPDESIEDLLVFLSERDLSAVRMLVEKTKEIAEVAYVSAMEGRVAWLAALLMVSPEKVNASIMVLRNDGVLGSKETTTIYECVIREAMSLGQKGTSSRGVRRLGSNSIEKRKLLLREIELLQLFGATVPQSDCTDRRVISPLIRASQEGDEAIVKLLLKTNIDVTESDGEGNSALHWCLRNSNLKQPRVAWLLLKRGANVSQRNRLGQTPLHVAAANGNFQALQILLLQDPECVHAVSEMKETPLFFAVKNDFMDCAQLLLRYGANSQLLNLRKQRPIDLAKSQDMRFLLSPTNNRFWSRAVPMQEIATFCPNNKYTESDAEMCEAFFNMKEAISAERLYPGPKTQICRYFESPGGCVRGDKCYFAHGERELTESKFGHPELKQGAHMARCLASEESRRKIFIGGLPAQVDSVALGKYFQDQFGSIEEATVIGSQAGDQVHSRGFGFVTFKHEESVAAAVDAHYTTILGKKVEIKGAVPKPFLITEIPKATPRQQQLQLLKPNEKNTEERKFEAMSWADRLLGGQQRSGPNKHQANVKVTSGDQTMPSWITTFKKWIPGFLHDVSKRLKEGEWYPLSSLKGDFRATCGLELDHAALGYPKLSDFMRSFPGICRMKVVPVGGRAPATHMVLLPNLPKPHQHQVVPITEPHVCSNLPPLDENDDDDFGSLEDLLSATQSHFGYGVTGSGSALTGMPFQERKDTTPSVDPRFLTFLQPDPQFLSRPWLRNEEGGEKDRNKDQEKKNYYELKALDQTKNNISFFLSEYDFHMTYWDSVDTQTCFKCKKEKMLWANKPCGHILWCSRCKGWIQRQGFKEPKCVICNAEVERLEIVAWWKQNEQPRDDTNDEEFPPLDPTAASVRKEKLASLRPQ